MTLTGLLMACALLQADLGSASAPPRGMRLIFEDPLGPSKEGSAKSAKRTAPESQFWLSAPSEWSFVDGVDDNGLGEPVPGAGPCLTFKSGKSYKPRVRSPHSLALLKGYPLRGDFVFEVEAMQTGIETAHRDLEFVNGTGQQEDIALVKGIQRSLPSRANDAFTFGHFEPAIVHFHKQMAEKLADI